MIEAIAFAIGITWVGVAIGVSVHKLNTKWVYRAGKKLPKYLPEDIEVDRMLKGVFNTPYRSR